MSEDKDKAPAEPCLLCGHSFSINGSCRVAVPTYSDGYHGSRPCGCHCKFKPELIETLTDAANELDTEGLGDSDTCAAARRWVKWLKEGVAKKD